jgi:hypothetical protein
LNVEPHFLTKNTVKGAPPADTLHARGVHSRLSDQ